MALDGLTAKANTGAGTDTLAGRSVGGKFVGAVMLTDSTGAEIASPATEATLAAASAKLPAALGATTVSGSLSVTTATNDPVLTAYGAVTETAPASDTASSGLNGRLQRIAQRLTSLIALLPTSLGQKTMSASLAVTVASDQSALTVAQATAANLNATVVQGTAANLKAQVVYAGVTATDKSGTIAAGGTAQTAIASNASRRGYWIQNLSAGDLWISDVGPATAASPSLKIVAGGLYESMPGNCPTSAISIIGATTSQAFAAREYT